MGAPVPVLVEKGGRFFARWSRDDDAMRSRNRSVLETPDSIDSVDDALAAALRSDTGEVRWKSKDDIRDLGRRLAAWRLGDAAGQEACAQIGFRLVEPPVIRGDAVGAGLWRLEVAGRPKSAARLRALGAACRVWPPLCGMADESLELEQSELEAFLRVGAPALRSAGYRVCVPDQLAAEVAAEAVVSPEDGSAAKGDAAAPLRAKVTIRVAGEVVKREEIEFLLEQGSSIVFFRGHWIEVDRSILKSALKVLEADGRKMTEREALAFAFGLPRTRGISVSRVKGTGWFGKVLDGLRNGGRFKVLRKPKGFAGNLRDYQRRGYSWLKHLTDRGFGALLADDMGLGKTVQTIAWILKRRESSAAGRVLIVAPVSVTMNWIRELRRFAPKLKVLLQQGRERLSGESFVRAAADCAVVVTGYPLFVKDFSLLSDVGFEALVLDEAQMIKNPDTRVSRAARSFPCSDRIALTGTPFENRVMDLWSIEEFLNTGMLGARSELVQDFERNLDGGASSPALAELKKVLEPFLLRRLKSDPGVAAELGPKREIREYCVLSPRQRAAYEVAVSRYSAVPREGRGRSGDALALLTELKLVCDGLGGDGTLHGGKVDRLEELLDSIFDAGESALVFTQYAKVGAQLKALLEKKFDRTVPFLHGGLSPAARESQISAFNSSDVPTAFVLSLKAGGFGLNLTKATHVIHYDRWWNPAVESQATDRAHRIGQSRTVFVHLFISHGTLEDRIDTLLEEKRALAGELVVSGESFLLKMSREEFTRTIALAGGSNLVDTVADTADVRQGSNLVDTVADTADVRQGSNLVDTVADTAKAAISDCDQQGSTLAAINKVRPHNLQPSTLNS